MTTTSTGLAGSLTNLWDRLQVLGREEDAFAALREADSIVPGMARIPYVIRRELAGRVHVDLSAPIGEVGRRENALVAIKEVVTIRRELEQPLRVVAWLQRGEEVERRIRAEEKE